jgi:UTP--glucose-1-phosphate uridylyltransferase
MIRKAIIPAAGLGIRFLPATKAQPKEMLPIIDTPTIQFVVQEAVDSGIEDILIISGRNKRAIEDHFDRNSELEERLTMEEKDTLFNEIRHIADMANIHYIRQKEITGLGDAIYHARYHTGNEPFAVLLGDTIINSVIPVTQQLIDVYEQYKCSIIAVEKVPKESVSRYGIVGGKKLSDHIMEVNKFVEKPAIDEAPSNLAIAGRYILTPEIYKTLELIPKGKNNEVQLTDALDMLCKREQVIADTIAGVRYDIGSKMDYLKTIVEYGLRRDDFADPFYSYLCDIVETNREKFKK